MRTFTRALLGGTAAILIATGMVGCAGGSEEPAAEGGLRIVTTTTQLTDFTTNVAEGTGAEITGLLQPNASAHSFEANAADLEAIRSADVVIMNGVGLETWLDDTLESAEFDGLLIDASSGIDEADIIASNEDDHTEDDHTSEQTGGETEHSHAEDEHDHGEYNPHIWTSPSMAGDMTTEIAEQLASLDEANADAYLDNATAYVDKLDALDAWVAENINTIPEEERLLVSNHDALTYFNHDYGITFIGSVMPSWEDNAEPSAAEIDALVTAIQESGVTAVFTETQLSPGTAEAIANEAGVKVYSGEDALYTDALGEAGSAGETFIKSTIHNTTQLVDSWGGAVTEPPAELEES